MPRIRRSALTALAAIGLAVAFAAPAPAAPVGVPVPPGGQMIGWGANDDGQANVPPPPAGQTHTAITGGGYHSLALTSDGQVTAWGRNAYGQTNVPPQPAGQTYTAIAAGWAHSLALTSDGQVKAWGTNDFGETNVPKLPAGQTYTAISTGGSHSLALTSTGQVKAWGYHYNGQTNVPELPAGQTYTAVAAGAHHSLALTSTGQVKAWGFNGTGQTNVPDLSGHTVTAIAAGNVQSLALTATGQVIAWGFQGFNQTGVPELPAGQTYTAIAAGFYHSLGLTSTGQVTACGDVATWGDDYGQTAVPPPMGRTHTAIAAGAYHSLALAPLKAPGITGTPPAAVAGQPYNHAFIVTGHPAPTVAVTAGTLPAGLTLSDAGVLSGIPTAAGSSTFTVTATNSVDTATFNVTFEVDEAPAAPQFTDTTAVKLNGVVGSELTREFTVTGNPTPTVIVADETLLPPGMTLTDGVLTGAPTTPGVYPFTLKAANTTAPEATLDVTVTVAAAPSAPAFVDVGSVTVNGIAGTELTHTFTTTGNPTPTVAVTGGALPDGLTLSAAGVLSGTPTAAGSSTFTLTATNSVDNATVEVTVEIAEAPASPIFTDAGPVTLKAVTGTALTREFTVTGNPTPVITVTDPATLPPGMTFTDDVLTGTPTRAGSYTFILNASNGVDHDLTLSVTVTVTDAPSTPSGKLFGSLEPIFGFGS